MPKRLELASNGPNLSATQERALLALLSEKTILAASEACGVPYRTLTRWLADSDFRAEYQRRLDDLVEAATSSLKRSLSGAVDVLMEIAEDREAPPGARISAARALLENGLRYTELTDLSRRLEAIESAISEDKDTNLRTL